LPKLAVGAGRAVGSLIAYWLRRDYYNRNCSVAARNAVSRVELEEFLAAMERLRAANTRSPEIARKFLRDEGFLTEEGDLAPPYTPPSKLKS
jgi:hypothetical protein